MGVLFAKQIMLPFNKLIIKRFYYYMEKRKLMYCVLSEFFPKAKRVPRQRAVRGMRLD